MASGISDVLNRLNSGSNNQVSNTRNKPDNNKDICSSDDSSDESDIEEMTSDFQGGNENSEVSKVRSGDERLISRLERELSVNPLQYDKHTQLIEQLAGKPIYDIVAINYIT